MKKKALLLALLLSAASSFSQTYFTEFFTDGLTANNPWVVQTPIDNGYEWDWTEFSGNGYALVTNFEAGTNYETESWLISPSIALTTRILFVLFLLI
jgi:hypothetical protein